MPLFNPSTITTFTTDQGAFDSLAQREMFFYNNRLHLLWCDGTNALHRSSPNGSSWTSSATVVACNRGYKDGLWYTAWNPYINKANKYLTYNVFNAYADGSNSTGYWNKGTINSDGTITWGTAATPGTLLGSTYRSYFTTTIDSSGYPWVAYGAYDGTRYEPAVGKATATDGSTWGTHTAIDTGLTGGMSTIGLYPFASGKMGVVYGGNTTYLYYQEYNGSSWTAPSTTLTSSALSVSQWDAAVYASTIYVIYLQSDTSNYKLVFDYHTAGGGWSGPTTLVSTTDIDYCRISIDDFRVGSFPKLMIVYEVGNQYLYYMYLKDLSGVAYSNWSTPVLIHDEGSAVNLRSLTTTHDGSNGRLGIGFVTGTGSPYNLKAGVFTYRKNAGISGEY